MTVKFKDGVDPLDLLLLDEKLGTAIFMIETYLKENNMEFVVTSIISDRKDVQTVSSTHKDGRAIDLRTRNWGAGEIAAFVEWSNKLFRESAAWSKSANAPLFCLYHNNHCHIQVKRND
jgi:hypothetical protein